MITARSARALCFGLIGVVAIAVAARAENAADVPSPADTLNRRLDFSLPTTTGGAATLLGDADYHVVCFLGTECPLARVYGARLQKMADQWADQGVRFIGVNSNIQDSMEELADYGRQHGVRFPLVKDFDRSVALALGAKRTPEVFILDRGGAVRYQGRIDDQYQPGISRAEPKVHDLRDAIEDLVAGIPVRRPSTEAVGCLIALPKSSPAAATSPDVTYCDQISRILNTHCVDCHRAGDIGPFALDRYDEIVGWSDMILEVIDLGRMPPWHATNDHAEFRNARAMPERDRRLLADWVEAGMPYGDADELPPPKKVVQGWRLPKSPDLVLPMNATPFAVPAEGVVEYQYYVVDPGFTEDKWVEAVEVIPGNRAVVHHCIAFTRPPDGSDVRSFGMLAAYVPGQQPAIYPEGYAIRVQAGSKIAFQMHYTPTGKPETDQTRIGLVFADEKQVTHEVYAMGGINQEFEIPPHAKEHEVTGTINGLPRDGQLLSITPHMHVRGTKFRLSANDRSGSETLLEVPHYDFNWQHNYEFKDPLALESIDSLHFVATFDNSSGNPTNPNPDEHVYWGDQTWQEMAVTFIAVAKPREQVPTEQTVDMASHQEARKVAIRKAEAFADEKIRLLDKNKDGVVSVHELPSSVRRHGWLDHNGDGEVSRAEWIEEASWRIPHRQ